jgi:UDP-2,3-diacylglucosamine pyrophosphatase LpxH
MTALLLPPDFRTVVVSDLHVSSGSLDDFDEELEGHFLRFLGALRESGPTELVINGDFLDFVQAGPWQGPELESVSSDGIPLCFSEDQSRQKLREIYSAHPRLFEGIGLWLASRKSNRLTILPGNHDVDFFWPSIRSECNAMIASRTRCSSEQVNFHLDRVFRPRNNPGTWIEHGHQYDSVNRFYPKETHRWGVNEPPIFTDTSGTERLYECIGTRFMIKYLNFLDSMYPFVDNIKPFSRFLKLFGASALVRGQGPLKAAIAVCAMLRYLGQLSGSHRSDVLSTQDKSSVMVAGRLKEALDKQSADKVRDVAASVANGGFSLKGQPLKMVLDSSRSEELLSFFAEHPSILGEIDDQSDGRLGVYAGTLGLGRGFLVDETQVLIKAAEAIIRDKCVNAVVMGHTHEPVLDGNKSRYLNSGSWTRYYRYKPEEKTHPWLRLKPQSLRHFPYKLLYIQIVSTDVRPIVFHEDIKHE